MTRSDFWDDQRQAQKVIKEINALKSPIDRWHELERRIEDSLMLLELASEEDDAETLEEVQRETDKLQKEFREFELALLLNGEYDRNSCILSLHPGAGGTESQDWAEMLMRMYTRWAEKKGFSVEVLDYLEGEEAGIKSVTLLVKGEYAYGFLHAEKGIHRLVRISPFDSSGRRHTSFASVDILPEISEDDGIVELKADELRIDTYRASGAGGQHVNKTDSAIRITHIPTGIVVQCQNERSQHKNKETAMRILIARLVEKQREEKEKELAELRGEQTDIGWGNQIRSYVFHPYSMVKDHRTEVQVGSVQNVMDGDIDEFIYAFLEEKAKKM